MHIHYYPLFLVINLNKERLMKSIHAIAAIIPLIALAYLAPAWADDGIRAKLEGYQEVPAVSSPGAGTFKAKFDVGGESISYELSYDGLEGTPFMSHIHLGHKRTNGGIMVWLCGNASTTPPIASPPSGTPACPVPGGTVSGVITAAQVVGPAGQLVNAGEFAEVVKAIKLGAAYVNVHTNKVPSGEIRGQVKHDDHD
jgi:CHRD domain